MSKSANLDAVDYSLKSGCSVDEAFRAFPDSGRSVVSELVGAARQMEPLIRQDCLDHVRNGRMSYRGFLSIAQHLGEQAQRAAVESYLAMPRSASGALKRKSDAKRVAFVNSRESVPRLLDESRRALVLAAEQLPIHDAPARWLRQANQIETELHRVRKLILGEEFDGNDDTE